MPKVLPGVGVEAVGGVVVPVPVVWVQVLLGIELRPEDPSCVASSPTPPGLKRPGELDVPVVIVPPTPTLELGVPVVIVLPIPMFEHVESVGPVLLPDIGPGLMPGVASSVAPMGIPVPPIGLIPSGEVEPIPGPALGMPICAWPGL